MEDAHLIGDNSTYDRDMSLVEDFVKASKKGADISRSVFLYYQSALYSYWSRMEEYIFSEEVEKDFQRFGRVFISSYVDLNRKELLNIQNKISVYRQNFDEKIKVLRENFEATLEIDIYEILEIFIYIGTIQCLGQDYEIMESSLQKGQYILNNYQDISFLKQQLYPLPNLDGMFGLNTYLYAYFEDIFLIGVPNRVQSYDITTACPLLFMMHDVAHSYNITLNINSDTKIVARNIYYSILNDSTLDRKLKELHILVLWVVIHEIQPIVEFKSPHPRYPRSEVRMEPFFYYDEAPIFQLGNIEFLNPLFDSFEDDFNKFAEYTTTEENMMITNNLLEQYIKPSKIPTLSLLWYRIYSTNTQYEYRNNPMVQPHNYDKLCTFIYSWNFIRTKYLGL